MFATAGSKIWSQGVQLHRDERVRVRSASATDAELEVNPPARPTTYAVSLNCQDDEWDCDCSSRERLCAHAVAGILLMSTPEAERQPTAHAELRYVLWAERGGLRLTRHVIFGNERVELRHQLLSIVAGKQATGGSPELRRRFTPRPVDLAIDTLIGTRPELVFAGDRIKHLLTLLADVGQIIWGTTLDGTPMNVLSEELLPRALVVGDKKQVSVTISAPDGILELVADGVARTAGGLARLGGTELTGPRLEHVPVTLRYSGPQLETFLKQTLPELRRHTVLEQRAQALPSMRTDLEPRVDFAMSGDGGRLQVMPLLVYGQPAIARIDLDRLTLLGAAEVPARNQAKERALLYALRDELNLAPGRTVEYSGSEAFSMRAKVAAWIVRHDPTADAMRAAALEPVVEHISTPQGGSTRLRFAGRLGTTRVEVDARDVLAAWRAGTNMVALPDGGWGRLPAQWLAKYGDDIATLIASMRGETLAPHARPTLARLLADLGHTVPPDLSRLHALANGDAMADDVTLPTDILATLRPYQVTGAKWLVTCRDHQLGAILADDMGLGKTLQVIAALHGRSLVVCPTSVATAWMQELAKFRPSLRAALYHGASRTLPEAKDIDVVITTYALLRNDLEVLTDTTWDCVILDESQAIKNPDSQTARAAYALPGTWRVALSGTPIENRIDELWSQFHFTNPGLLGDRKEFVQGYDRGPSEKLHARLRPFLLRRKKIEVAPDLPPRTETTITIALNNEEQTLYNHVLAATQAEITALVGKGNMLGALEALLRLRQVCNHPALLPGITDPKPSSKVEYLVDALSAAAASGHKALVFSQWTSFLDLIEPALKVAGLGFLRLDGSTTNRGDVVAKFQADEGPPVMLLSLKAGGTGLTLTAADHVFICDPWWNPAVEDQAADRAHRIGQDKPVNIYRLVAQNTVEERVLALAAQKRLLAESLLAGTNVGITKADILALLR
ncbi:MAG: DEAD/DEAH box helicase [Myxococcales bacterium]|nr:DEAD/DEAH box helicase [Myxococcales bacterium]